MPDIAAAEARSVGIAVSARGSEIVGVLPAVRDAVAFEVAVTVAAATVDTRLRDRRPAAITNVVEEHRVGDATVDLGVVPSGYQGIVEDALWIRFRLGSGKLLEAAQDRCSQPLIVGV
jgi:hypothetical protein